MPRGKAKSAKKNKKPSKLKLADVAEQLKGALERITALEEALKPAEPAPKEVAELASEPAAEAAPA